MIYIQRETIHLSNSSMFKPQELVSSYFITDLNVHIVTT